MSKHSDTTHSLNSADIDWQADGTPRSKQYDDVYYSRVDGLEESRHVFLEGNQLAQRWRQLPENAHFIIIETGFGTGLNFLACWQLWQQVAPGSCHLHYISIEKHPLSPTELQQAHSQWPEFNAMSASLLRNYPESLASIHQIPVSSAVQLSLGFGDIIDVIRQICDCDEAEQHRGVSITADAWLLDGFAPARNPDMWSSPVIQGIAALSARGTTFATFTAAGSVKRELQSAGFQVRKVRGFGRKRDMLCGEFEQATAQASTPPKGRKASAPWHCSFYSPLEQKTALVIGGGLAGCHTARALADSGWQVSVLEQSRDIAEAASGNPSGILYTRLAAGDSNSTAFGLNAYLYACRQYRRALADKRLIEGEDGRLNGMLQLACSERELATIKSIAHRYSDYPGIVQLLDATAASNLAGVAIQQDALLFPMSGWLAPRQICRERLDHPAISLETNCRITQLEYTDSRWIAGTAENKRYQGALCVVCSGTDSIRFEALSELPTKGIGGQISLLPSELPRPALAICHSGYIAAASDDRLYCGASFRVNDDSDSIRTEDHCHNLEQLSNNVPGVLTTDQMQAIDPGTLQGRGGVRCTTPDYLPIVGPVPDWPELRRRFAPLAKDAKARVNALGAWLPGLYVNTGHGSRGLATTPIAAVCIAALANQSPRPLPWQQMRAINPARFAIRDLVRSKS